jgi:hypothetical protein
MRTFKPHPRVIQRRGTLVDRDQDLVREASTIDGEQQQLARQMSKLRHELTALHSRLWPTGPGHAFKNWRRPRVAGPPPIPAPLPDAIPVHGARLRSAALGVLLRARHPLTLSEIHRALYLSGYRIGGRHVVKQLADALGYEHQCGRARRVSRGVYTVGQLSPARRRPALGERARRAA